MNGFEDLGFNRWQVLHNHPPISAIHVKKGENFQLKSSHMKEFEDHGLKIDDVFSLIILPIQ